MKNIFQTSFSVPEPASGEFYLVGISCDEFTRLEIRELSVGCIIFDAKSSLRGSVRQSFTVTRQYCDSYRQNSRKWLELHLDSGLRPSKGLGAT